LTVIFLPPVKSAGSWVVPFTAEFFGMPGRIDCAHGQLAVNSSLATFTDAIVG
jgi:hypothetical protein